MTSHPTARSRSNLSTWRGVGALLILSAVALGWWATSTGGSPAEADGQSATASAPPGFSDTGVVLSSGTGGPQVTVFTDLTCPYCQSFFDDNSGPLRELVDDGTHDVTLA